MSQDHELKPEEIALLISLAESGDKTYQFAAGILFSKSYGVTKDDMEAVEWFEKAAKQGHPDAQFNMGQAYFSGKGVIENHSKALYWYGLAAEQGDSEAMFKLGILYLKGNDGVPINVPIAVKFIEMAKEKGDPDAIKKLEKIYKSDLIKYITPYNTH